MSSSSYSVCEVCNQKRHENDYTHNNTPDHVFNFQLFQWQRYRKALVKNRHGVELEIRPSGSNVHYSIDPKKGKHTITLTPDTFINNDYKLFFSCIIKNIKRDSEVYLTSALVLHPYTWFSLRDPKQNIENEKILKIQPGSTYEVFVQFNSVNKAVIGTYQIPVAFNFQAGEDYVFTIARSLIVSIEDGLITEEKGKSPFTNNDWPGGIYIHYPTQKLKYQEKYLIPRKYFNIIKYGLQEFQGMTPQEFNELRYLRSQVQPNNVNRENYQLFWHILLWTEEMGQKLMLNKYNMEKVKLTVINNTTLELEVPGLAEKRPSVINNDMIDIKWHETNDVCYRGIIKKVKDKSVEIAYVEQEFIDMIEDNPDIEVDVRFMLSRLNLERMHQAVDQVVTKRITQYLFPNGNLYNHVPSGIHPQRFYNSMIAQNTEQKTAVLNILNNSSGPIPYIVFGPPGTGKTVTIVEAILQLKDHRRDCKILVCAPANAACDMLTEKLSEVCQQHELIRVFSETVDRSSIPQKVLEYSNYTNDGRFQKFTAEKLMTYRIVVTTLGLIGRYQNRYQPNIVVVDEAAQACEPEINCALGVLEGKQVIFAGDPKQLGPFSSSHVAEQYGYCNSLLERLMALDIYQSLNEKYITMLKLNFRSHNTILEIPNKLFYKGLLHGVSQAAHNDILSQILIYPMTQPSYNWTQPRKKGQAVEYCNVISKERREGRSPSYFNDKEAETVLAYVQALVRKFQHPQRALEEDIGVVTPYIRQMYKIRELLGRNGLKKVEVGTTETFQGREKRVMIISTVRAQQDLLLYDRKYNLGFVRNDKRFNVALTRAKSKLIVIGCAHVLATDTKWVEFIKLCEQLQVACGAPLSLRTDEVKTEVTKRIGRVEMVDAQHRRRPRKRH